MRDGSSGSTRVRAWVEAALSFAAMAGLLISLWGGFDVQHELFAGSDFKIPYAAASSLAAGRDAYDTTLLHGVFARNGVVEPATWYARTPIYPPPTFALLVPFTLLPMVMAARLSLVLSGVAMAVGLFAMLGAARREFGVTLPWQIAMVCLAAAAPQLSLGLGIGNVSVAVSGLCLYAVFARDEHRWLAVLALALGMLLKPHLAFWVVVGMFVGSDAAKRRVAVRAAVLSFVLGGLACLWIAKTGSLAGEFASYARMVHAEFNSGSNDPTKHDLMPVATEVMSLQVLVGYWFSGKGAAVLTYGGLAVMLGLLLRAEWKARRDAAGKSRRLLLLAGWSAFGLLATYHRGHDSVVLLMLLPWMVEAVRSWTARVAVGVMVVLYGAMGWGPGALDIRPAANAFHARALGELLIYRQCAVATLLLAAAIFWQIGQGRGGGIREESNEAGAFR